MPSTVTESQLLPSRSLNAEASNSTNQPRQDLVDTFQLFRSYLDHKLVDLKADILSEQKSFTKKFREDAGIKFKSEETEYSFVSTKIYKKGCRIVRDKYKILPLLLL